MNRYPDERTDEIKLKETTFCEEAPEVTLKPHAEQSEFALAPLEQCAGSASAQGNTNQPIGREEHRPTSGSGEAIPHNNAPSEDTESVKPEPTQLADRLATRRKSPWYVWRRAGAAGIDLVFAVFITFLVDSLLCSMLQIRMFGDSYLASVLLWVNTMLVLSLYSALFETSAMRRTPGKFMFNLAVISEDGNRLPFMQAFLRQFTAIGSLAVFGVLTGVAAFHLLLGALLPVALVSTVMMSAMGFYILLPTFFLPGALLLALPLLIDPARQTFFDELFGRLVVNKDDLPKIDTTPRFTETNHRRRWQSKRRIAYVLTSLLSISWFSLISYHPNFDEGWHLHRVATVPQSVLAKSTGQVAVLTRDISPFIPITSQDLELKPLNSEVGNQTAAQESFGEIDYLVGRSTTEALRRGETITPQQIEKPEEVLQPLTVAEIKVPSMATKAWYLKKTLLVGEPLTPDVVESRPVQDPTVLPIDAVQPDFDFGHTVLSSSLQAGDTVCYHSVGRWVARKHSSPTAPLSTSQPPPAPH